MINKMGVHGRKMSVILAVVVSLSLVLAACSKPAATTQQLQATVKVSTVSVTIGSTGVLSMPH